MEKIKELQNAARAFTDYISEQKGSEMLMLIEKNQEPIVFTCSFDGKFHLADALRTFVKSVEVNQPETLFTVIANFASFALWLGENYSDVLNEKDEDEDGFDN